MQKLRRNSKSAWTAKFRQKSYTDSTLGRAWTLLQASREM